LADTLSQEQIDAMLAAAQKGETIAPVAEVVQEVKEYDFRAPKKFTRERMKVLDSIFDGYARLLSTYLTGRLRLYCKVTKMNMEEQRYFEFNNALPDYVMMGLMALELNDDELDDVTVILQLSNTLTFVMIDRLLGGKGEYKDTDRDFTEIEVSIMDGIIKNMASMMKDPWSTITDVKPVLYNIETNSRVVSAVGYDDTCVISVLEVVIGEIKTMVTICIPAMQLDGMMAKYSSRSNARSARRFNEERENERKNHIKDSVVNTMLDVTAVLGEVNLDMADIINLQAGDIIPLGVSIDSNVSIKVGNTKWFDGKIGKLSGHKAVRIENTLNNFDQ
jgi:flagellar motor switch protein FliM